MPTFTAIALDSLLEHGAFRSVEKSSNNMMPVPKSKPPGHSKPIPNPRLERRSSTSFIERKIARPQMTPALYATPEATPVPESPSSYPPSPYIINHKRRGPNLSRIVSEDDLSARKRTEEVNGGEEVGEETKAISSKDDIHPSLPISNEAKDEQAEDLRFSHQGSIKRDSRNDFHEVGSNGLGNGVVEEVGFAAHVPATPGKEGDGDWFFDPQDSLSYASNTDDEDCGTAERSAKFTPHREFFDAQEELSSDTRAQSSLNDLEEELRGIWLSLLMEMERRKQLEETLSHVRSNWKRIREQLSQSGITLPENLTMEAEPLHADTAEELCRQVDLVRFVSEAIGRGVAKAEAETMMEARLEAKNFEVARLLDRLHYYETVNHEMSQMNQEAVEASRRRRQERKKRQRWIWGSFVVAASLGATALAWSYMQSGSDPSSASHDQESVHANDTG